MTEEEEFFAWLDGELDGETARRVAARVAADPELQALAADHRALGANLRTAFAPLMEATPPPLRKKPPVAANDNRGWLRGGAVAASLALAVLLGLQLGQGGEGAIAVEQDGRMIAAASLDEALDTKLASLPDGDVRIGLTFHDRDGRTCRSFEAPAASGVACHEGGDWALEGMFAREGEDSGDYRMASGPDPRLGALVDGLIEGEAFDADAERAARDNGWQARAR